MCDRIDDDDDDGGDDDDDGDDGFGIYTCIRWISWLILNNSWVHLHCFLCSKTSSIVYSFYYYYCYYCYYY